MESYMLWEFKGTNVAKDLIVQVVATTSTEALDKIEALKLALPDGAGIWLTRVIECFRSDPATDKQALVDSFVEKWGAIMEEIHGDSGEAEAKALTRIANALDRVIPPPPTGPETR